jgi:hypothetical protein
MALNCRLTGIRPGQGEIEVTGSGLSGERFELAVQRSTDERYLGADATWQATPYWHRVAPIIQEAGSLRLAAGSGIVDGLLGSVGAALRVLLRAGGREEQGMLRVKGLLGSEAADQTRIMPPRVEEVPPSPPRLTPDPSPVRALDQAPEIIAPERSEAPRRPPQRSAWHILLLPLALVVAALLGAWYLGWLDPWLQPGQPSGKVAQVEQPGEPPKELSAPAPATSAPEPPAPEEYPSISASPSPTPPPAKGLARLRELLATGPTPQAMYEQAQKWDQAGDCAAAVPLYARAAGADPAVAAEVARLYDPEGFAPTPCISKPDEANAALWYEDAAHAGDPKAQARLGEILTAGATSGPVYEDGVEWLRKAASAGKTRPKQQAPSPGQP